MDNSIPVGSIVFTKDGKEGTIIQKHIVNSTDGPRYVYYTDIPNFNSPNTGYIREEFAAYISYTMIELTPDYAKQKQEELRKKYVDNNG